MPLSQQTLSDELFRTFSGIEKGTIPVRVPGIPPPPLLSLDACLVYANTYDGWVKKSSPIAGPLVSIVSPGNTSALAAALSLPLFAGWGPGLLAYWSTVLFAGPGFIPVNPILPPSSAAMAAAVTAGIVTSLSPVALSAGASPSNTRQLSDTLAGILFGGTKLLQVLGTTTTAPPVVTPFPLI